VDTRLKRKVSVQSGKTETLTTRQQRFLAAIIDQIERSNLCVLPQSRALAGIEERLRKVAECRGVIVLAFSQWECQRLSGDQKKGVIFPTEFTHIGAVLATATRRPILVLREKSVAERGVLRRGYYPVIGLPNSLGVEWLDSEEFKREFRAWLDRVNEYKHVFLGYSTQAAEVGNMLYKFLNENLKLRVFDWQNFPPGESIWESIERAERLTSCGIFLFMADDTVTTGEDKHRAPRDNVVYEAGYFAGAKGRLRSIVIHEEGARVPSDLGGILNLPLGSRRSIAAIETALREQLGRLLSE
jgi:hypothetical protein